jgi:hypothetical protein
VESGGAHSARSWASCDPDTSPRCATDHSSSAQWLTQRPARLGERVLDTDRNLGIDSAAHDGAAFITEDLPATPATLDWVYVSPALRFGAHMPAARLGRYRLGDAATAGYPSMTMGRQ